MKMKIGFILLTQIRTDIGVEKMWKKWKRNKGSLVIESAFVYPITFFVIFFLIYMGNIHFLKARIQTIVSNEAVRYAAY